MKLHQNKAVLACLLAFGLFSLQFSDRPPRAVTGAVGEVTCAASNCHNQSNPNIDGEIELNFPAVGISEISVGITVSLVATEGNPQLAGFQLVGVGIPDTSFSLVGIGSFSDPGTNVSVREFEGKSYLEHSPAKQFNGADRVSYFAQWNTPKFFRLDSLTIYAAAVFANGDGRSSGDRVVLTRLGIPVFQDQDDDQDGFFADVDCNDADPNINPGAEEIVNNDVDEDCDGIANQIDEDGDGWNSDEDCDDLNPEVNPGALEVLNNEVDENCDGEVLIIDRDLDGYHSFEDCDDSDSSVNPGATEIPGNNVDENCDNIIDDAVPDTTTERNITVIVEDRKGRAVPMVTFRAIGQDNIIGATDDIGSFSLMADDIEISMYLSAPLQLGLSASDIVAIGRHILRVRPFDNESDILAADVNGSGTITATDIISIRNVILQQSDSFSGRVAWQFVPEVVNLEQVEGDTIRVLAYKLGDVNASALD